MYARLWHHVDGQGQTVGRLATQVALTLMGKHKPGYIRHVDLGDYVVVTNAAGLHFTGNKWRQKGYYRHSGYPGGLTRVPAFVLGREKPEQILLKAVRGMLPKNRLRDVRYLLPSFLPEYSLTPRCRMARLKVFAGDEHPYEQNITKSYEGTPQRELDFNN